MNTKSIKMIFLNLFVLFACLFATIIPFVKCEPIFAEGETKRYYYIVQNTILIPEGQSIKGNIQLNSTYYVQTTGNPDVVINDVSYRYVIYNGITGLVQSSSLSKKSIDNISNPYFVSQNKLTVETTDDYALMFFNINDEQINCRKIQNNTKLDFLAYSENGKYVLCKLSDGAIGFIQKSYCTPTIIYTPHPNPINPDTEIELPNLSPDGSNATPVKDNKATITRIILIVTLCVIVVIVIFLLFKPTGKRRAQKDDFYDFE